ncbi:MAG: uracil-DNA glycosylase family protein [Bacteroidia bacterium]
MKSILKKIAQCEVCRDHLPLGPKPIVRLNYSSKIIIIGQAPGKRVHETGIPWNDASGKKLREWLGLDESDFYDSSLISIMPMGFCYPGKGTSGDLPPRSECAPLWHSQVLKKMKDVQLILLIGQYAQRHYLKKDFQGSLTDTVKKFRELPSLYFPLPHPSPRNQNWLKVNPWFTEEVLPELRKRIRNILNQK